MSPYIIIIVVADLTTALPFSEKNGLWNPEKWISSRSPNGHTPANKYNKREEKKANNDLKERIIEEGNDDIILSPQRGSFGTGCHVSSGFGMAKAMNEPRNRDRDHFSERNKSEDSEANHRSNSSRRIGTGRVGQKERERERTGDWPERSFDKSYDRNGRDIRDNRDRNDDFSDRRNRNRGFYDRRPNNRNNRYDSDRRDYRNSRDEEEEPEWFTEGPTSKLETIELKGFDEDEAIRDDRKASESKGGRKDNNELNDDKRSLNDSLKAGKGNGDGNDKSEDKTDEFDVNAWMKTESWFGDGYQTPDNKMISSLGGISNNFDKECDNNNMSRFKRWFQENPNQTNNSVAMDSRKNDNMINRNESREVAASGAVHSNTQMSSGVSPEKIFELLKGSNRFAMEQLPQPKIDPTKMINLAEIEAHLPNANSPVTTSNKVFDKLFTDMSRKSVQTSQTPSVADRAQSLADFKGDAAMFQTQNTNLVIPKAQQNMGNAPSILDMLREEENKEAMADLQRNNRVLASQALIRANANVMSGHNSVPISQNSAQAMPTHGTSNGANLMALHNWQNNSPLMKVVRPNRPPNVSANDMSDQTNLLFQSALIKRQQMEQQMQMRPQSLNESIRANTPGSPARSVPKANFFTPTSVMRNMHSEKDKSVATFNEMTSESNSSQQKFLNEVLLSKPSPMRPIVKSNNPIGHSMTAKKHVMQSPMASHSDPMSFAANPESALNSLVGRESQLVQQLINQNSSPLKSYQRPANSSNASVRPFGLEQSQVHQNSMHSPNAVNRNNILQMLNQSNVRPNPNAMSINQMMALQHNSNEGRQSQYFQSRPITAASVQSQIMPRAKLGKTCDSLTSS